MAPLQKRAWWGLAVGIVFAVTFAVVFALKGGIETFETDQGFRLTIDAILLGSLLVNFIIIGISLRKPGLTDERDRLILTRAPYIQWIAVIVTLAGWMIALNEIYHETGLMPADFMYVIFMSVLIVSTLAQSTGILVGYWRMDRNARYQ